MSLAPFKMFFKKKSHGEYVLACDIAFIRRKKCMQHLIAFILHFKFRFKCASLKMFAVCNLM